MSIYWILNFLSSCPTLSWGIYKLQEVGVLYTTLVHDLCVWPSYHLYMRQLILISNYLNKVNLSVLKYRGRMILYSPTLTWIYWRFWDNESWCIGSTMIYIYIYIYITKVSDVDIQVVLNIYLLSMAAVKEMLYASVAVLPAPVHTPSQIPLAPSVKSVMSVG